MLSCASKLSVRRLRFPEICAARDWTLFLKDLKRFCPKVIRYSEGLDQP